MSIRRIADQLGQRNPRWRLNDGKCASKAFETIDEVVFARPGDLQWLGARTLEGFNAVVDPRRKRLVAAGPMPVA